MAVPLERIILVCFCVLWGPLEVKGQCDPITQTEVVRTIECTATFGCFPNLLPIDDTFNRFDEITPSGLTGCTVTAPNNIITLGTLNGASECVVNIFTCRNSQCDPMTQTEQVLTIECTAASGCPDLLPSGDTFIRFQEINTPIGLTGCTVTAPNNILTVSTLGGAFGCDVRIFSCRNSQCDPMTQTEQVLTIECTAASGCPDLLPSGDPFIRFEEITPSGLTGCTVTAPNNILTLRTLNGASGCVVNIFTCRNKIDPTTVAPTTIAPTTVAPTTVAPTTIAPTTIAPTTVAPTTVAPTTIAPTTIPPTTIPPTTMVPSTTETDSDTSDCSDTSEGSHSKDTSKGSHSPDTSEGSHSPDTSEGSHSSDTSKGSHSG